MIYLVPVTWATHPRSHDTRQHDCWPVELIPKGPIVWLATITGVQVPLIGRDLRRQAIRDGWSPVVGRRSGQLRIPVMDIDVRLSGW